MRDKAGMKLVFRVGECRFTLPVEDLVEIRENSAGLIDSSGTDAERRILGSLFHRGENIRIRDIGARLEIADAGRTDGGAILVLSGEDSRWGVVADEVEGLFPGSEFAAVVLPPILAGPGPLPYVGLDRWRDDLLVRFEADRMDDSWEK